MGKEIERKWLLSKLPDNIEDYKHKTIIQGYLSADPVIRVRKEDEEYYLTYKGKGEIEREEYNLPLNRKLFDKLREKCEGIIIEKTRYYIPVAAEHGEVTAEVDVFSGVYEGKVYVEVEFETIGAAVAFAAPEWFGEEVTGKKGYTNAELALGI